MQKKILYNMQLYPWICIHIFLHSLMAKRIQSHPGPAPQPKRSCPVQTSLDRFFKNTPCNSTAANLKVDLTPHYYGIHVYDTKEIAEAKGLDRDYKLFWNNNVRELCADRKVRHKLQDKGAIQGAVNTAWTLHKTELLKVQADELLTHAHMDETACSDFFSTIKKHVKKISELTDTLRHVYTNATVNEGKDVSKMLSDLRLAQSALKKAIARKKHQVSMRAEVAAAPTALLSPECVCNII